MKENIMLTKEMKIRMKASIRESKTKFTGRKMPNKNKQAYVLPEKRRIRLCIILRAKPSTDFCCFISCLCRVC